MKKPLVVIVGRPNVGKSTLFNRLVGKMEAIVHDISGVTRDRNYGEVEWNNKKFMLIDTGGYVPDSPALFDTAIREQIELAVRESDKIVLVVDVKDGITPVDQEIANILRASGKDCILTVNKVDSEHQEPMVTEFYSIGLGEPVPVSAGSGRGTGDFLDILSDDLPEYEEEEPDERPGIAIVGRPNAGKSSLTNALLGYDRAIVTEVPGTTRDSLDSVLKYHGEELVLIDTAGLRKRTKVKENIEYFSTVRTLKAISESTITIVMIDALQGFERQDQKIIEEAVRRRKGLIIAVNKWDAYEKDMNSARDYEKEMREKLGSIDYVPIIFISAITKKRIYKLVDLAIEIHNERMKKIPTSELNEKLIPEIEKHPPPATSTGREVKLKYVTQVGKYYPIFLFFTNYPKHIPDSYRRYIEKQIRSMFGFQGVPFTISFREK